MNITKRQFFSALSAAISFIGAMAGNVLTNKFTQYLESYEALFWMAFVASLIVAVGLPFWENGTSPSESLSEGDLNALMDRREAQKRAYLQRLIEQFRHLPMRVLDPESASAEAEGYMGLADVYVGMNTTSQKGGKGARLQVAELEGAELHEEDKGPLSVLEAVIQEPRLVLLGDPGGGKSTFVNHLAYCLANHGTAPRNDFIDRLQEWPQEWEELLPVPVTLREVAAWLQEAWLTERQAGLLNSYLEHWLHKWDMADFHGPLLEALREGKALLLLDGLDEVPVQEKVLYRIKEMIADLPRRYGSSPMVVTCRVLSYQDPRWQLQEQEWPVFELAPLTDGQIEQFIQFWHERLAQVGQLTDPEGYSGRLLRVIQRPDLQRLVRNPLLLTVMALVHTYKGELPDARVLLYEEVVDLMLVRWERAKLPGREDELSPWRRLLEEARLKDIDVKKTLWRLAYEMHKQMPDQTAAESHDSTADMAEGELLEALWRLHPEKSRDWAYNLVQIMQLRAGLLVESRPQVYSFPHRTFQEFLAACHLASQGNFTTRTLALAEQGAFWREVILLATSRLVHEGREEGPLLLISELCPDLPSTASASSGLGLPKSTWRNVWLAGQVLVEVDRERAERTETGEALVQRVRTALTTLVTAEPAAIGAELEPRERAEAGNILSRLGDERDFDEMIPIPAGEFLMGSSDSDSDATNFEKPQHSVYLPDYSISKYPVTNVQYARFIQATEHSPPRHWAGDRPPAELLNHPVVEVTWYDAQAYCRWLRETTGLAYRLPTEAEWEKAARGSDGRIYPWGNAFDASLCNMNRTGIGDTSSVGLFAKGASPYGALDMAGNVWEWTSSLWGPDDSKPDFAYPYVVDDGQENLEAERKVSRVLRGGSWVGPPNFVRAAYRDGDFPDSCYDYVGFRVLL